ncbi:FAD binding domain-containing protein [Colletotrichum karsti]|uniref:FAD binding domain-containing protein n=1 Tax=Colletotrichum karsti TaxID=1095194 RepID=A0A9P6I0J0_9PEZI|nr:FAD binding domain-containing protein [Colletotrichum karsti]KAF9874233.1 FAD binding domain-containing protein [Colletotrichum karsti]
MGILLSSSGLKQLRLSEDRATVTVGPANSWGDVYRYLDPAGLTAVGGRLGVVGVPGFLLGGGISFFSNEYGWASANVQSYEAILSDGEIVTATANNKYSDLFWALRGGGNSFAIVTSFDLKTVDAPVVTVGVAVYGIGQSENFLDSVYHYALDGSQDKKSAVIPNCQWSSASPTTPSYTSYLFYNGNNTRPEALSNFTTSAAMPADLTDVIPRTMGQWATATEIGWDQAHGLHFRFRVLAFRANREAMSIVHDTFMALANQHLAALPGMGFTITFMPISKSSITANRGHGRLGDPMGIDESQGPFIWVEASSMFPNGEHEEAVTYFYDIVNAKIESKLAPLNVLTPYLYLNDADKRQPVFEGYGRENLARLKKIRDKYDPDRVYTDQMPGGFKVAAAK